MQFRNILKVSGFTLVSRILGLIRDILLGNYLGVGGVSDAFFVALKIPNLFRRFFAEGSMQSAFVPLFSRVFNKNIHEAREFSSQVFTIFFLVLLVFLIIIEIFAEYLVIGISPGFKSKGEETFTLAVFLVRITLPYLFFISVAAFYSSILNSLGKFSLVAFLPALLNLAMIGFLLFGNLFDNYAISAAWGFCLGGFLQMLCVGYVCYKNNWLIRFSYLKNISYLTRSFFKRLLPVVLGAGVYQVNIVIDVFAASLLPLGAISYLFYADRLYQLPLALIGIALATVVLPNISNKLIDNNEKNNIRQKAIILGLGFALPATIALIFLAEPIIKTLFFRGKFLVSDVHITALVLVIYSLSLPANILIKIYLPFFYAQHDTKTPFYNTLLCLGLNIILVFPLARYFGVYGIATATVIASWVNFISLWFFWQKRNPIPFSGYFFNEIKKLIVANITFIILMMLLKYSLFYLESFIGLFWFRFIFIMFVLLAILFVVYMLKLVKSLIFDEIINVLKKS